MKPIPVENVEIKIYRLLESGRLTVDKAIELMDEDILSETGRYLKKGHTVNTVPVECTEKEKLYRNRILVAAGIMMYYGLPACMETYDSLIEKEEAELINHVELCRSYCENLIRKKNHRYLVNLTALDSGYYDIKNGHPSLKESFRYEQPEVAEALRFIQGHGLFRKLVRRKPSLHTPSQPFYTYTGRCQYSHDPIWDGPLLALSRRYRTIIDKKADIRVVDVKAEEIGIAGALSGDTNLINDYSSGEDVYDNFITNSGLDITRDTAKVILLGFTKGMTPYGIALRSGISLERATELVGILRSRYDLYNKWALKEAGCLYKEGSEVPYAVRDNIIRTPLGFTNASVVTTRDHNERLNSAKSFRVQAYGSILLYRVLTEAIREGIVINGTLHDSIYVTGAKQAEAVQKMFHRYSEQIFGIPLKTTLKNF